MAAEAPTVALAGAWRFELDRGDVGVGEKWFERALTGTVHLPGTLAAQGIGDPVTVDTKWIGGIIDKSWFTSPDYARYRAPGNVKVPFWLQPESYYAGAAWYQRELAVPASWRGKRVVLTLERPHWETRVWVDGNFVGSANALGTPHRHDLGVLAAGSHRLTVRVDNRMVVDVGENSHSVSDHTQGNWNGIVGRIELAAHEPVSIERQRVVAANDGVVRITHVLRGGVTLPPGQAVVVTVRERAGGTVVATGRGSSGEVTLKLAQSPRRWSEFAPELYVAASRIEAPGGAEGPAVETVFGFREIATRGTQFAVNGQPVFFRGTLDCANYPRTGHPPMDVAEWRRVIGVVKAHGLNLIRFHSWCPPEAAFIAADELGCYLHVEASTWPNHSTSLGDGKPIDTWLHEETARILAEHGNHPSFVLMAAGNEPGGKKHAAFLAQWVNRFKAEDGRRLFTAGAGWPEIAENQWHNTPKPRIQAWGDGLKSRINARPPETRTDYREFVGRRTVPVVSHEIGQWCVFPNLAEIEKYTGYLKARNFEIFRETLDAHGLGGQAKAFLQASGKLQTLCYKEDIESALRTPGMGGFELLDLHDFPGQGTALVGVLDAFWEEKGYVTPAEYRRFCNATVPLARMARRVFTTADTLEAEVEVAHFGAAPLERAVVAWRLVGDNGSVVAKGQFAPQTIGMGNGQAANAVKVSLAKVPAPARYRLVVGIDGTVFENDWDVWVYPAAAEEPAANGVLVTDTWETAREALAAGGRVILTIPPARVRRDSKAPVALGFSSIFWNTAWTRRQAPTTLGVLCDPRHAALAEFPTDAHSNWQWWYLVSRAGAMILDELPREVRPVVQVIDDWVTSRKLGLVFEARVGRGRLLVCSVDLSEAGNENPVVRQLRQSLVRYAVSERFAPTVAVGEEAIARVMGP
ncbi:MAG: glycoside hydrolase [Verrucomicrobia bacterium]|nr:glycoside hydrolase [Verrucomicrobiota bacterium]